MKPILLFGFLMMGIAARGQNIILPDGEFMDTASVTDTGCSDYGLYYYSVRGKYPENSFSLLKALQQFLQKEKTYVTASGYITFRFKIDCAGQVSKKVQVLQTDESYQTTHFGKDFVSQLFLFFRTLDKWQIAKTREGVPLAYNAFLSFKIDHGKVVNIIP